MRFALSSYWKTGRISKTRYHRPQYVISAAASQQLSPTNTTNGTEVAPRGLWPGCVVRSPASGSDLNHRFSVVGLGFFLVSVLDLGSWVMDLRGKRDTSINRLSNLLRHHNEPWKLVTLQHSSNPPEARSFPGWTQALGTIGWALTQWATNDIAISRMVSSPTRPARHSQRHETRNLPGACTW